MNDQNSAEEPSEWEAPDKGRGPRPTSFSWLRFFVWLGPAVTIFLFVLFFSALRPAHSPEFLIWPVVCFTTVGFGIADAHLRRHASEGAKRDLVQWTIIFTLCQVILTPLIWFLGMFGFCALATSY